MSRRVASMEATSLLVKCHGDSLLHYFYKTPHGSTVSRKLLLLIFLCAKTELQCDIPYRGTTPLLISCDEVLIYGKRVITAADIVATFFSRYVNIVLSSKHVIRGSVYQVDP